MTARHAHLRARRSALQALAALAVAPAARGLPAADTVPMPSASALRAASPSDTLPGFPEIAELAAATHGQAPRMGRLRLDLPRLADNGNAVPMKMMMPGPFAPGEHVTVLALYSERNPVPLMTRFEFPAPLSHVEIESRVRLAGSQRVVALATLANGEQHAAIADVIVTLSGCLDGT